MRGGGLGSRGARGTWQQRFWARVNYFTRYWVELSCSRRISSDGLDHSYSMQRVYSLSWVSFCTDCCLWSLTLQVWLAQAFSTSQGLTNWVVVEGSFPYTFTCLIARPAGCLEQTVGVPLSHFVGLAFLVGDKLCAVKVGNVMILCYFLLSRLIVIASMGNIAALLACSSTSLHVMQHFAYLHLCLDKIVW